MRREDEIRRAKLDAEKEMQKQKLKAEIQMQRKAEEKERKKEQAKFIARLEKFPEKITKPKGANRNQSKLQDYVVWKGIGNSHNEWVGYKDSLEKKFDSSYATKKEANERTEYLFYVKNDWGWSVDRVLQNDVPQKRYIDRAVGSDGLLHLKLSPPARIMDSQWTVKAVPRGKHPNIGIML